MSVACKIVPPVLVALIGAFGLGFVSADRFIALAALGGSVLVLAVVTLLAAPVLGRPSPSINPKETFRAGWVWLAALWFIPIAGYAAGGPINAWRLAFERELPVHLEQQLKTIRTETGRYPGSIRDIAFWDIRRHFVRYQSDGTSYQFSIDDPARIFVTYVFRSGNPQWVQADD